MGFESTSRIRKVTQLQGTEGIKGAYETGELQQRSQEIQREAAENAESERKKAEKQAEFERLKKVAEELLNKPDEDPLSQAGVFQSPFVGKTETSQKVGALDIKNLNPEAQKLVEQEPGNEVRQMDRLSLSPEILRKFEATKAVENLVLMDDDNFAKAMYEIAASRARGESIKINSMEITDPDNIKTLEGRARQYIDKLDASKKDSQENIAIRYFLGEYGK